ncbi:MAG: hypothetical protein AAF694_21935 [Bacteroidota bacterium]
MRNSFKILPSCILLAILLNACIVSSIHPLWTKENRIFNKALIGKWYEPDCKELCTSLSFKPSGDTAYIMRLFIPDGDIPYKTHMAFADSSLVTLVKLGKNLFLDIFPMDQDVSSILYNHYIPVHTFLKVKKIGTEIELQQLNAERLETLFGQKRVRLSHEISDDHTILTASTKQLIRFMEKYANDPEAFEEPINLVR